jgi:hypothetical protein
LASQGGTQNFESFFRRIDDKYGRSGHGH